MRVNSSDLFVALPKFGIFFLQQSLQLGSLVVIFDQTRNFAIFPIKLKTLIQDLGVVWLVVSEDTQTVFPRSSELATIEQILWRRSWQTFLSFDCLLCIKLSRLLQVLEHVGKRDFDFEIVGLNIVKFFSCSLQLRLGNRSGK